MKTLAILSDIHANLPALTAVLDDIDAREGIAGIYHLGDLVGYAPWPNEVASLLRQRGIAGIAGNYDSTVATRYAHCGCRYEDPRQEELSHQSFAWTLAHTIEETRAYLDALPFRLDLRPWGGHVSGPKAILLHGNPVLNTVYWTEDRPDSFCRQMAEKTGAREGDLLIFGHTHRSMGSTSSTQARWDGPKTVTGGLATSSCISATANRLGVPGARTGRRYYESNT